MSLNRYQLCAGARRASVGLGALVAIGALGLTMAACGFDGLAANDAPARSQPPSGGAPPASGTPHVAGDDAGSDAGADAPPVGTCSDLVLSFDGVDDAASVPDDKTLDLSGDFTVEAWIKPTAKALGETEMDVLSHHDDGASKGWLLRVKSGRVELIVFGDITLIPASYSAGDEGPAYLVPGQWGHVAGVQHGRDLRIYYNGVLKESQSLPLLFGRDYYAGPLAFGRASTSAKNAFEGELDDVRLSKVARFTDDTAPIPTAVLPVDADTVASWRFDEPGGTALLDGQKAHDGAIATDSTAPSRVAAECIPVR